MNVLLLSYFSSGSAVGNAEQTPVYAVVAPVW